MGTWGKRAGKNREDTCERGEEPGNGIEIGLEIDVMEMRG